MRRRRQMQQGTPIIGRNERQKLQDEVLARRKALEATLARAKTDAKTVAEEKVATAKKQLDQLRVLTRDGWDQMTESTARKLNDWLRH
jgi:hypothetical protein